MRTARRAGIQLAAAAIAPSNSRHRRIRPRVGRRHAVQKLAHRAGQRPRRRASRTPVPPPKQHPAQHHQPDHARRRSPPAPSADRSPGCAASPCRPATRKVPATPAADASAGERRRAASSAAAGRPHSRSTISSIVAPPPQAAPDPVSAITRRTAEVRLSGSPAVRTTRLSGSAHVSLICSNGM